MAGGPQPSPNRGEVYETRYHLHHRHHLLYDCHKTSGGGVPHNDITTKGTAEVSDESSERNLGPGNAPVFNNASEVRDLRLAIAASQYRSFRQGKQLNANLLPAA